MKKGYWVVSYRNEGNPESIKAYGAIAMPILKAAGAKPLAVGLPAEAPELGEIKRTVVVEFESLQKALDTYHLPEYAQAIAVLDESVERDFRIVEGTE